ncbi:MAG: T4SS-associated protein LvhB7 [Legionella sp.]
MMTIKGIFVVLMMSILTGCASSPPDLDAPCTQFGRYCPQYPINEAPQQESKV